MNLIKRFSEVAGISVDELTSGSRSSDLIVIRGVYIKLKSEKCGHLVRDVGKELNITKRMAMYARKRANQEISIGYEDTVSLWESVKHLDLEYLCNKAVSNRDDLRYLITGRSEMLRVLDLACKAYDENYDTYSYKEKKIIKKDAERWLKAIVKTI